MIFFADWIFFLCDDGHFKSFLFLFFNSSSCFHQLWPCALIHIKGWVCLFPLSKFLKTGLEVARITLRASTCLTSQARVTSTTSSLSTFYVWQFLPENPPIIHKMEGCFGAKQLFWALSGCPDGMKVVQKASWQSHLDLVLVVFSEAGWLNL